MTNFVCVRLLTSLLCLLSFQSNLQAVWQPPEVISNPLIPQKPDTAPVLKVNPQGNAIVIWTDAFSTTFPDNSAIATALYLQGAGWQNPQVISSQSVIGSEPEFQNQDDPDIAMNSTNYAVAVWEVDWKFSQFVPQTFPAVMSSKMGSPGNWDEPVFVNNVYSDFVASNINVSLNENGTALAAWRNFDSYTTTDDAIGFSFLPFGGSWSDPFYSPIFPTFTTEAKPYPFINDLENAVVTWQQNVDGTTFTIQAANYIFGVWSFTTLDMGLVISQDPRCALANNGNAVAIWLNGGFVKASFFNGTSWGTPVTLGDAAPLSDSDGPIVVVDPLGNFTATWTTFDNSIKSSSTTSGFWTTPVTISSPATVNGFDPFTSQETLAVNTKGDVIAIWHRIALDLAQPSLTPILSAFKPFGLPWRLEELVAAPSDGFQDNTLNIGLADCGFAAAAWQNLDYSLVYASINEGLLFPVDPVIAQCCQKGKGCINVLTWTSDPCVLFYNIFRDGVLIATVLNTGGPLQFIDFNARCHPNAVYTISAVSVLGFESDPIPFI